MLWIITHIAQWVYHKHGKPKTSTATSEGLSLILALSESGSKKN